MGITGEYEIERVVYSLPQMDTGHGMISYMYICIQMYVYNPYRMYIYIYVCIYLYQVKHHLKDLHGLL